MLSKDEILKKKGKSPEQLDLVKDIEVDKSKVKSRLLLLLFLFLFVGSSSLLWIYREYRTNGFTFNFSLPELSLPIASIQSDKNAWQVCLFDKTNKSLVHDQNCDITNIPDTIIKNNINLIKSTLPNGLIITEQVSTSTSSIDYISDISSPKSSFVLIIKIFGSYPLDNSQQLIPKLASDLYWQYSK